MEVPQWFKDLKLNKKIWILLLTIGIFTSFITTYSIYNFRQLSVDMHEIQSQMLEGQMENSMEVHEEAHQRADRAWKVIILLWIATTVAALIITNFFLTYLSKAISNLVKLAEEVSAYNLTRNVKRWTKDEVGHLFGSFGDMINNQRALVTKVKGGSEKVSAASEHLAAATEEMNATMEEVSSTIQNLAKGAQSQAQQVGNANDEMKKISDGLGSIATSAHEVWTISTKADKAAQEGGKAAGSALGKMEDMKEVVSSAAKVVTELGETSKQIGDIVDVITNIAAQTNLLALNAAIEAARAGEHGRGFAVVADEVKKLAEGSGKAAEKIAGLIEEIQTKTAKAVESMEMGVMGVEEGTEVVKEALLELENIVFAVGQTSKEVAKISSSTEEQLGGVQRLSESLNDIAAAAEETAASTQEVSAATEEQTASMEDVSSSAQLLRDLSLDLHEVVDKFKIERKKKKASQEAPKESPAKPKVEATKN